MGGPETGFDHDPVGRLDRLGVEIADDDGSAGSSSLGQPRDKSPGLRLARAIVHRHVMQVRDHHRDGRSIRDLQRNPERRTVSTEVQALGITGGDRFPDKDAVAVFGTSRPPPVDRVAGIPGGAQQAILPDREDTFLQAEQVGLDGRHVGEQEREPLGPAIRDVPEVEGRDVQMLHQASRICSGCPAISAIGRVIMKVAPEPSPERAVRRPP